MLQLRAKCRCGRTAAARSVFLRLAGAGEGDGDGRTRAEGALQRNAGVVIGRSMLHNGQAEARAAAEALAAKIKGQVITAKV